MMRNFIIGCALFGIFVGGAITGGFIAARYIRPVTHERAAEQFARQQFHRIVEQLNLTAAQKEKIRPVLTDASHQIQARRREILGIIDQMDDALRAQLTDEQREKYDHWRTRQREKDKQAQRWMREYRERRSEKAVGPKSSAEPSADGDDHQTTPAAKDSDPAK
jgi:Skp family chaperone for outer membrane proteins